jgi:phosphoglycolate phosphatase-like HAD superfamily hydrolase
MARNAGARLAIGVLSGIDDADTLRPAADLLLPSIADLRLE